MTDPEPAPGDTASAASSSSGPSIEDIILDRDRRGISALRHLLPPDFCARAAALFDGPPRTAFIATGFYFPDLGMPETDGPPGATLLGRALQALGWEVVHVTDQFSAPLMRAITGGTKVVEFPILGPEASATFARALLDRFDPAVLVAVERCGVTACGKYLNMRGHDITAYNARLDTLFDLHPRTIGIADGGNEIGMGNVAEAVARHPTLVNIPCHTRVTELILSSVSNWGALGLIAALSRHFEKSLLPTLEEEGDVIRACVDHGAVDGISLFRSHHVDGFALGEHGGTLLLLKEWFDEV